MAGSSTIGALRVDLGLNSAQFTAGLKKAEGGLAAFGRAAGIGLAAVATAAAAASIALGVAVRHAIDHADALSKSAQKAGVTVEALSRLEYAAKLSDVSLEGMTASLGKLGKSMIEAAQNSKSGPATAFAALGIAVKDSAGNIRASDDVFKDIADRFSKLPDGATKTALAMQLLGKSGAQIIPLLNGGADGLKRFADESDRTGNTISTKTARAAEEFNDTLTRIGGVLDGVVNRIMEAALPALQQFADLLASPEFADAAASIATSLIDMATAVTQAIVVTTNALTKFGDQISRVAALTSGIATGNFATIAQAFTPGLSPLAGGKSIAGGGGPAMIAVHGGATAAPTGGMNLGGFTRDRSGDSAADAARKKIEAEGKSVFDDTRTKLEKFNIEMGNLGKLLQEGAINQDTYSRAVMQAQDNFTGLTSTMETLGSSIAGLIKGTSSLSDVLLNIASKLVSNIDFSGMGSGGGLLKGLLGGLVGGYASGTSFASPGAHWVGENGPELMNFRGGESVTPMGGGEISVHVMTEVKNGNLVPTMAHIAGVVSGQQIRQTVPAIPGLMQKNGAI